MSQPIFKTCSDCGCKKNCIPAYLARPNDYFTAEISDVTALISANLILNGTFDTDLTHWTQTVNPANIDWAVVTGKCSVTLTGAETSERISQIVVGNTGFIHYTLSAIPANTVLKVKIKNAAGSWVDVATYTGNIPGATIILPFSIAVYGVAFVASHTGEGAVTVTIDDVEFYTYLPTMFSLKNCCDDTVIDTLDWFDVTFVTGTTYVSATIKFRYSKYTTTGQIKLCYDKEIVSNGTFLTDLTDWTQINQEHQSGGELWVWDSPGVIFVDISPLVYSKIIQQLVYFEKGCEYELSLQVRGNTDIMEIQFNMQTDDLTLDEHYHVVSTATVVLTEKFTPEYTGWQNISFFAEIIYLMGDTIMIIENISIITTVCSPCFEIAQHDCTLYLEATNNQASYGLTSAFDAKFRFAGNLFKDKTESKENVYRNSIGDFSNPMTDIVFVTELETFVLHKDQIRDLILYLSFDNVMIDKNYYVKKEGNIEIDWDSKMEFGKFKCDLYAKNQFLEKVS